jgi:N-methylhydantoinase A
VFWTGAKAYKTTPIYAYELLRPGNVIAGPAVVEGEYTTLVVPSPMTFSIDERGLGILEG